MIIGGELNDQIMEPTNGRLKSLATLLIFLPKNGPRYLGDEKSTLKLQLHCYMLALK